MHHDTKLKSSQTGFLSMTPDLNPIEYFWDVVKREIHLEDVQPTNLQHLCDALG